MINLSDAISALYIYGIITGAQRDAARKKLAVVLLRQDSGQTFDSTGADRQSVKANLIATPTVKQSLTVESCHACGALPCDWVNNPWSSMPWVVTLKESGGWRFLIDSRDQQNPVMFSGFKIDRYGSIGNGTSLGSGSGGRLNLHRSYFIEDLPE